MQFEFEYRHMISGFVIASYDGTAHIAGNARDWHVEAIELDGSRYICSIDASNDGCWERQDVELPRHDAMHSVILDWLYSVCDDEVEEALIELGRGGYATDFEGPMQHERL